MDDCVPLPLLQREGWAEVVDIAGPVGWKGRLAELGLRIGAFVRMIQPGSPCLFQVGGARISLRCDELSDILVRPVAHPIAQAGVLSEVA